MKEKKIIKLLGILTLIIVIFITFSFYILKITGLNIGNINFWLLSACIVFLQVQVMLLAHQVFLGDGKW